MVRRLSDIELDEVSLVDEGAVKRKFLIIKKQNKEVKVDKDLTLEDVEGTEVEKKLSEKGVNAIKGALKILKPYMDELTPKIKDAVGVLAEAAGYGEAEEYAEPEEKKETKKAGRKLSKTTVEKIQSIIKELSSLIEEAEEAVENIEVKKAEIDWDEVSKYIQAKTRELIK